MQLVSITKDTLFHALEPYSELLSKVYDKLNLKNGSSGSTELFAKAEEINRLVDLVTSESERPLLPFVLGWNYSTSRASEMFLAMSTAATVYEALNILNTYYQSYSLFGERIYIESGEKLSLKIDFPWPLSENISLQKMACCRIQRLLYDVFSHQFMPIEATNFSFANEMSTFFKISPKIINNVNGIIFYYSTSCFSLRPPSPDATAFNHFKEKLKRNRIAVLVPECDDPILATNKLFGLLGPDKWKKESFAEELGISVRHYERTLKRNNTSFNVLLKRKIQEVSTNGIIAGDSIDFIGIKLGYSERKSFERAFKKITGITPAKYRELVFKIRFQSLKNNILNNERVPLFSNTTSQLISYSQSEKRSIEEICKIIEPEPVLVAKIMSYASSAFYSNFQVKNLHEAITKCLGIDSVLSLSMSIMTNLGRSAYGFSVFSPASVWSQILITSEVILLLKKSFSTNAIDWNGIYFTSLFKDVGLVYLLDSNENEITSRFESECIDQSTFTEMNEQIRESFGVSPYSLSTLILLRWGTDINIRNMISNLDKDSSKLEMDESLILAFAEQFALHIRTKDLNGLENDVKEATNFMRDKGVEGLIDISKIDDIASKIRSRATYLFS
ncbi:HDOD domain-containing protein [Alteromonas gracilis]|uniref:HDOD domain-containing protein n=1 Tax=Alteromonas gracilis TaxID=1479524 RepID=UPI0037361F36